MGGRETFASRDPKFMRAEEVMAETTFTRQYIARLEERGLFPARVKLGSGRVLWVRAEVEAWIAEKLSRREPTRWSVQAGE